MEIEPKTLGVPLYKKNWSPFWLALGCIGVAALSIRASSLSQWLTAIFLLGPAFWVAFGGPMVIHRWQNSSAPLLRGLIFVLRIAFLLGVLWYVVPFCRRTFRWCAPCLARRLARTDFPWPNPGLTWRSTSLLSVAGRCAIKPRRAG
jgi:hypothetical protein